MERILIDDGGVVKILSYIEFQKMGLKEDVLKLATPIYGFANHPIKVKGIITLPITLRQDENTLTVIADFLVVDQCPLMKLTNWLQWCIV